MRAKTMMKAILALSCLAANPAAAAKLKDVKILGTTVEKDGVELKLHTDLGAKDSYFLVKITKLDKQAFDKLLLVMRKQEGKDQFQLNLDIPSFSPAPSGSFYRSERVKFSGVKAKE